MSQRLAHLHQLIMVKSLHRISTDFCSLGLVLSCKVPKPVVTNRHIQPYVDYQTSLVFYIKLIIVGILMAHLDIIQRFRLYTEICLFSIPKIGLKRTPDLKSKSNQSSSFWGINRNISCISARCTAVKETTFESIGICTVPSYGGMVLLFIPEMKLWLMSGLFLNNSNRLLHSKHRANRSCGK